MTKRKDERRELLKEDEFLSFLERIAQYIEQNSRKSLGIALGVLAFLAIIFGWISYSNRQADNRARDLYRAESILEADLQNQNDEFDFENETERYEAALAELDRLIDRQSGLVRQQALVHKVKVLTALGRFDEIEQVYQQLHDGGGQLSFMGAFGLAELKRQSGAFDEAMELYSELRNGGGFMPDFDEFVEYHMALTSKEKGDLEDASRRLNEMINRYEGQQSEPPILARARTLLEEVQGALPDEENG
jgi:predicted negative regulator of RcsB-dependent stress response